MLEASAVLWYLKWHGQLCNVSTAAQVLSPSPSCVLSSRGSEKAGEGIYTLYLVSLILWLLVLTMLSLNLS